VPGHHLIIEHRGKGPVDPFVPHRKILHGRHPHVQDEQGVSPVAIVPATFALLGNHPNPFNPATILSFRSERGGAGRLEIFDVAGRRTWDERFVAPAGPYQLTWRGVDHRGDAVPAGVYLYRLTMPDGQGTGRMTLAK